MTDLKKLTANLEKKGYIVRYFDTPQEAADYLDSGSTARQWPLAAP